MTAFVIPNAIQVTTRKMKYTFASFITRDTSYEVIHNIWNLSHPRRNRSSTEHSTENGGSPESGAGVAPNDVAGAAAGANGVSSVPKKGPTHCACGKKGEHYETIMMDCLMPGTPAQIHTLMWTSSFIRDFMVNNQKLTGAFPLFYRFLSLVLVRNSTNIDVLCNFCPSQISKLLTGHRSLQVHNSCPEMSPTSDRSTTPLVPNPPSVKSTTRRSTRTLTTTFRS